MIVFEVQHVHPDPAYENVDSYFHIGFYSSRSLADQAIERLRRRPGFADYPDHFRVLKTVVDESRYEGGFDDDTTAEGGPR